MPTYEYRCTECGADLEVVQRFTDPSLTTCEACGGSLRKVFSAVGVVFKGSGFYATDNRASKKNNGSSGSPAETSTGSGGSSADTKTTSSSDSSGSTSGSSSSTGKKAPASASASSSTSTS